MCLLDGSRLALGRLDNGPDRGARTISEGYSRETTSTASWAELRFTGGGFMIEPRTTQERGLRPGHKLTVVAAAVVAAIVAYLAFGWIVGLIAFLIKTVVVIAVIGGVLYLVFRHSRRH